MNITTILPVTRLKYLDRVLESLLAQTYKPNNLIVVFDGLDHEFATVRNKVVGLDYYTVRCVSSRNNGLALSIPDRRVHIVEVHKQLQEIIEDTDWIFSIEDDGILPPDALQKLVRVVQNYDDVGMVSGVELGRWGVPYVGAWRADDIHNTTEMHSLENKSPQEIIEEIDACGLYCALIRADKYKEHEFTSKNGHGPDVNLGLYLRREGYKNYIDWSIPVTHLTFKDGQEIEISPLGESRVIKLKLLYGNIWQAFR